MTKGQYLRSQWLFILFFVLAATLLLTVVQLDLWLRGLSLEYVNIGYAALLVMVMLLGFLAVQYYRQKAFYANVQQIGFGDVDVSALPEPVTLEQELLRAALLAQYRAYTGEVHELKAQQQLQQNFQVKWVHYMKTPLSVISLMLQELPDAAMAGELREEVERLNHGLTLALHDARLKQFSLDLKPVRVELGAVLREVVNEYKRAFIKSNVFPKVQLSEGEAVVETDEKWLAFVLGQFISNAVKYSRLDDGKARQVTLSVLTDDSGTRLDITDEGIGIPPEDMDRVFESFFTGSNGKKGSESTGMGLYLAREVCNRLGHHITLRSTLGVGTTATLFFPRNRNLQAELR